MADRKDEEGSKPVREENQTLRDEKKWTVLRQVKSPT